MQLGTVLAYWLDYGMIREQTGEVYWIPPVGFLPANRPFPGCLALSSGLPELLCSSDRSHHASTAGIPAVSLHVDHV